MGSPQGDVSRVPRPFPTAVPTCPQTAQSPRSRPPPPLRAPIFPLTPPPPPHILPLVPWEYTMSPTRSPSRPKHTPPEPLREPDIVLPFATTTSTPTPANETDTISGGSCITTLYDADGDLTTDAAGNTYAYDAWNRLTSVTNSSSVVVASYAYDGLGRCITETNTTGTYDYYYNESGQVVETDVRTDTDGKVYQQFVWDPRAADTPLEMTQFSAEGYATNSYFYMQDANGNVTGLVDTTGAVVERYAYDAYGNVTIYSGNSWSTTVTPQYDLAGNMISGPSANDPTVEVHYTWDAWDRLTEVCADDGSGNPGEPIATYTYDALNRRIQKTVGGSGGAVTDYYYNQNWQVVEETTTPAGTGTAATHYVWDQRGVDTPWPASAPPAGPQPAAPATRLTSLYRSETFLPPTSGASSPPP